MSWFKMLIDFIKNNWSILKDHPYQFITIAIICVGLTLAINKLINTKKDKQIKYLKEEKEKLKKDNEEWEKEYCILKQTFKEAGAFPRLLSGINTNTNSSSAKKVSNHINYKYLEKKQENSDN